MKVLHFGAKQLTYLGYYILTPKIKNILSSYFSKDATIQCSDIGVASLLWILNIGLWLTKFSYVLTADALVGLQGQPFSTDVGRRFAVL